jgi:hypothetical protein
MKEKIRIGCGAGFSGDRLEPSLVLIEKGELDYLVLECLAERTIALAQKRKLKDPSLGYDPLLERRIELLLPSLVKNRVKLITNMGAANPKAAAEKIITIAKKLDLKVKIVAVTGDDVLNQITGDELSIETRKPLSSSGSLISANAYMGIEGIMDALAADPDIIVTGRVADPSLFLAPMIHEFNWQPSNHDLLGQGTIVGHLLECAGQVTGGYYADPRKPVPDLANLGHPFADVAADGSAVIGKVDGTGGVIDIDTAKEQLLYEVVNPFEYFTPDVVANFTTVQLNQTAKDKVAVHGGTGKKKPDTLKVSVGYQALYLGEGEITYAGSNAVARARLAGEIVEQRLKKVFPDLRIDLIGHNSVHGNAIAAGQPYEVRLRIAGKAETPEKAALIGEEVEALYTNGPGGGGGVKKYVNEVVGIVSTLVPRSKIKHQTDVYRS